MKPAELRSAFAVFVMSAVAYVATVGWARATTTTPDAHFVHLANSYLHGQLDVVGGRPPTSNDWARFGGRWFVSFPPFPAVLMLPAVALWGTAVWDRLFWAVFAGLGPALVYLLLRRLGDLGYAHRSPREQWLLTGLFGFGTVFFFTAVQGSVWFAAHVVATVLIALYLLAALGARQPLLAGLALGLCFMTRPTTLLLGGIFVLESGLRQLRERRPLGAAADVSGSRWSAGPREALRAVFAPPSLRRLGVYAVPLLAVGVLVMWLNVTRFEHPLSFGHEYLQVRWRARIEQYGLFNYHYLGRNLAVFLTSLPWVQNSAPFVQVSRHGLALWVTTPGLLWLLWPKRVTPSLWGLGACAGAVALLNLCYQNSGWVQFGYRFSLDYLVVLFVMLAMGARRLGVGFHALAVVALLVNLFGAATFDRLPKFYDRDPTQRVLVQPD